MGGQLEDLREKMFCEKLLSRALIFLLSDGHLLARVQSDHNHDACDRLKFPLIMISEVLFSLVIIYDSQAIALLGWKVVEGLSWRRSSG